MNGVEVNRSFLDQERGLKILFVTRATSHYSYHVSTINQLRDCGHRVQVLFGRDGTVGGYHYSLVTDDAGTRFVISSRSKNNNDRPLETQVVDTYDIELDMSKSRTDRWVKLLVALRETRSFASYLARQDTSFGLGIQRRWIPGWIRRLTSTPKLGWLVRGFLASSLVRRTMAFLEDAVPPDAEITRWVENQRPDVVVISPINFPSRPGDFAEEVEYLKSAKKLGIPTVVPVLSWDNLTARGFYHIKPDLTLAWNTSHVKEAVNVHGISSNNIVVTGSPPFDKWIGVDPLTEERDLFTDRVGIPHSRPFILYLGSSGNVASDETWLIRDLAEAMRQNPNPMFNEMHLLVRPHPANVRHYESLASERISIWPKEGALPDSETAIRDLHNSLRHCIATVGINTTGMVDALINDKPCIALISERYKTSQMEAPHFHHLLSSDVLELARNADECVNAIENLAQGIDHKTEARSQFLREFVRPRGVERPAGKVAAMAIEMTAHGISAAEIDGVIDEISATVKAETA